MLTLAIAIALTISISAFCSMLEAMILSTTHTDVETLKERDPKRGAMLEDVRGKLQETISSILTLNTLANTLGSVIVGGLAAKLLGDVWIGVISAVLSFSILIFAEIIPKTIGVHYRRGLQPVLVYPLRWFRIVLRPVTWLTDLMMSFLLRKNSQDVVGASSEILLLARKGAAEGDLDGDELNLISNSLSLASIRVRDLMTPRTVVNGAAEDEKLIDLLHRLRVIRFGRMPVYKESLDTITGVVRRRDILHAIAIGEGHKTVGEIKMDLMFFPDVATADYVLKSLLGGRQQLGMVVDEFGGFLGVISIEDIVEHLIGKEIYENDDVAVDMRQLARLKSGLIGLRSD